MDIFLVKIHSLKSKLIDSLLILLCQSRRAVNAVPSNHTCSVKLEKGSTRAGRSDWLSDTPPLEKGNSAAQGQLNLPLFRWNGSK